MKTLIIFCLGMLSYRPFMWLVGAYMEWREARKEVNRRHVNFWWVVNNIEG